MTRTQAKKNRIAQHPAKVTKPRNAGVVYTIQQLKADHAGAGGRFFEGDNSPVVRTHGHPKAGRDGLFFIGSSIRFGQRLFTVYSAKGDKIKAVHEPFLTHGAAMAHLETITP